MEPDQFRYLSLTSLIVTAATVFGLCLSLGYVASPVHRWWPQLLVVNPHTWLGG